MTSDATAEIAANLERAEESLGAARALVDSHFFDSSASRSYYAAFYAATALLLAEGLEFRKHSAVIALVHQRLVRSGTLPVERGKDLNWLFQLRTIGDYGGMVHVSQDDAERAIQAADSFLSAARSLLEP
jgi:uncharacterized protein (UPF0332 family)